MLWISIKCVGSGRCGRSSFQDPMAKPSMTQSRCSRVCTQGFPSDQNWYQHFHPCSSCGSKNGSKQDGFLQSSRAMNARLRVAVENQLSFRLCISASIWLRRFHVNSHRFPYIQLASSNNKPVLSANMYLIYVLALTCCRIQGCMS